MSIIIISSDSRNVEEEMAKRVADAKGFDIVDCRVLEDVAKDCNVDPGILEKALENTPSILKKMPQARWRYYLSCIEAEVLERLRRDNVVCWGVAAHLYVIGVSHAMKVRLISGSARRAASIAELQGTSMNIARRWVDDEEKRRKKWSLSAYGIDETSPSIYDLVINLDQIDPDEAVGTIIEAVGYRKFRPVTYSVKCLSDLAIAARVRAELLRSMKDIRVQARDGTVIVFVKGSGREKVKKSRAIKEIAGKIDGVSFVEVHVKRNITDAEGMESPDRSRYPGWPVIGKTSHDVDKAAN